ncbi:MAG: hypothetical protein IPO21_04375 [Bacteroidales bacterium]|nr:hypothetical protein [Bacteroidales bacterium]
MKQSPSEALVVIENQSEQSKLEEGGVQVNIGVDYYWDYGRLYDTILVKNNSKEQRLEYEYGKYEIILEAINEFGCGSRYSQTDVQVDITYGLFSRTL